MLITGNLVDIHTQEIYPAEIHLEGNRIRHITRNSEKYDTYILPGFVDAHIHIESSMLVPSEFAKIAVQHGTVSTVSDPHEIANVLGIKGVEFMIENGEKVPFKFNFGAPSCVPATSFETAGATIDANDILQLLKRDDIKYLAEMMNFPGVIYKDEEVLRKIQHAKDLNKVIDGHAPGLRGEDAKTYFAAGISTDHECFTYDEAKEKLDMGVKILIREGSAAKNYNALAPLIAEQPDKIMFCSDDKHPDDLLLGHVNELVVKALKEGYDFWDVLRIACKNPVTHYGLDVGLLREGEFADFIVVKDLDHLEVMETWIDGACVYKDRETKIASVLFDKLNNFNCLPKSATDFEVKLSSNKTTAIEALDGELITNAKPVTIVLDNGFAKCNVAEDVLKIAVINRYNDAKTALGFITNFGIREGAIASSVAHDCHNIVAVGTSEELLAKVVNEVIENKGGLAACNAQESKSIPLEIAGIMSHEDAKTVGKSYAEIDQFTKQMGCTLKAPFMTLSFMALLVIPKLKMSDKGLFDGEKFEFKAL